MRKYLFILMVLASVSVMAQKTTPKIYIKVHHDKAMFYEELPETLLMSIKDGTDGYVDYFLTNLKKCSLVTNYTPSTENQLTYYTVTFNKPLDVTAAKQFFNDIHAIVFYTNKDHKVYVKDLLTPEEIQARKNIPLQHFQTTDKCSNPNYLEYYNFNIYNIEAKTYSMYVNNYPMYLMNGSIATFNDKLQEALEARNNFLNRK